ncbi:MAG: proline dehydrogenase family protein, partial [Planctomycetota bacterium]
MSWFDSLAASLIPLVPMPIMRRLSVRYIAGEKREDALKRGAKLISAGYGVIYDQLGEAVADEQEVQAAKQEYLDLLQALEAQEKDRNISLKPTQMGLNLSEDLCTATVRTILDRAATCDAFTRFEMEESETVDGTLRVFHYLRQSHGAAVGVVLQSMLFRTEQDARDLLESDLPLNVRLVKGIYVEPAEIAYQDGAEVNASYLRILRLLLEGGAFVAAATHDEKLIAGLQEILKEHPQ